MLGRQTADVVVEDESSSYKRPGGRVVDGQVKTTRVILVSHHLFTTRDVFAFMLFA